MKTTTAEFPAPKRRPYPKLVKLTKNDVIVLMQDSAYGTVVHVPPTVTNYEVGKSGRVSEETIDFNGTVTLENS